MKKKNSVKNLFGPSLKFLFRITTKSCFNLYQSNILIYPCLLTNSLIQSHQSHPVSSGVIQSHPVSSVSSKIIDINLCLNLNKACRHNIRLVQYTEYIEYWCSTRLMFYTIRLLRTRMHRLFPTTIFKTKIYIPMPDPSQTV